MSSDGPTEKLEIDADYVAKTVTEILQTDNSFDPSRIGSFEEFKESLTPSNISNMLNKMASTPEDMGKLIQESMGKINPDMLEQARKLVSGGQGDQIIREMKKKGLDPVKMRKDIQKQQKLVRKTVNAQQETIQGLLITASRQIRVKKIPLKDIKSSVISLIKCPNPVELPCSRLEQGPLANKSIKIWYNPDHAGKNKRASKIIGFPMGGEILILSEIGDLSEKDFLEVEETFA